MKVLLPVSQVVADLVVEIHPVMSRWLPPAGVDQKSRAMVKKAVGRSAMEQELIVMGGLQRLAKMKFRVDPVMTADHHQALYPDLLNQPSLQYPRVSRAGDAVIRLAERPRAVIPLCFIISFVRNAAGK